MTDGFYFDSTNGVVTLRCAALDSAGFKKHCFTTRLGGVSTGYLESMNMSFSRESADAVNENYRRVFNAVGFSGNVIITRQEHTDIVKFVDSEYNNRGIITNSTAVDGFVTAEKGLCLAVFVADCVPIIIADPINRAVACVHSGWRGTASRISANAVNLMHKHFGSDARCLIAAVGPCIGACCYEVGQDVYDGFAMPRHFAKKQSGKYMLDLKGANREVLEDAGLLPGNIFVTDECTMCKSDLYYSHRATGGKRGNMTAMIEI